MFFQNRKELARADFVIHILDKENYITNDELGKIMKLGQQYYLSMNLLYREHHIQIALTAVCTLKSMLGKFRDLHYADKEPEIKEQIKEILGNKAYYIKTSFFDIEK